MPSTSTARYAAVTSTLALLVALGGTSYAAVKIGTKDLKNNAVVSSKIKNDSVTGADVKERTLATVPNADTAVRAQEADIVDGTRITTIDTTKGFSGGRPVFPVRTDDLAVELGCAVKGGIPVVSLTATTTLPGGIISAVVVTDSDPGNPLQKDAEDDSFQPAASFDLLVGDDGDTAQVDFVYSNADGSRVQGMLLTDAIGGPDGGCRVTGIAFSH